MKKTKIWTWCGSSICMDRQEHVLQPNDTYICTNCGDVLTHKHAQVVQAVQDVARRYEDGDKKITRTEETKKDA